MKDEIILENTKDELIVIVDENDNVIGSNTRKEMRMNNLIHRCTSIIVVNQQNNKVLVGKRAKTKEYCPGYFDLMFGGVVGSEEGGKERDAAIREVNEEIGLDLNNEEIISKCTFEFLGKTLYKDELTAGWHYFYVLKITSEIASMIKFTDGEVESAEWLQQSEIVGKIKKDEKITPDSIHCFYFYLDNLK